MSNSKLTVIVGMHRSGTSLMAAGSSHIGENFGSELMIMGSPIRSSGQAGSCVFLVFHLKNQVFLSFKLNLNMTTHPVITSIGVNMHQSSI